MKALSIIGSIVERKKNRRLHGTGSFSTVVHMLTNLEEPFLGLKYLTDRGFV